MLRKGASPHLKRWIQVRLSNRQSWIIFKEVKSKKTILKQGVPKAPSCHLDHPSSSLIYDGTTVADLYMTLFADAATWAQDRKLHVAEAQLQQALDMVTTRRKDRKMLVSAKKTVQQLLLDDRWIQVATNIHSRSGIIKPLSV